MSQATARSESPTDLAPEVSGLSPRALPRRGDRQGFAMFIPGECLKLGSRHWTPEQLAVGVWLKGIFLTASEEEEAIADAQREGRLAAVGLYQIKKSLSALAEPITTVEADPHTGLDHAPGAWKPIPALELRAYWEELGPQGRSLFTQAYQTANTPSEAAREVALRSFRSIA
jgi:hypothetical protein